MGNTCKPWLFHFNVWQNPLQIKKKSLHQHHSSKASILQHSAFFIVQLSHPYMTIGKTIALTRRTFVSKVMSLLFNIMCMLVIDFLSRHNHLLISWLQSTSAVILEHQKTVCHCFHCFPIYLLWSDDTGIATPFVNIVEYFNTSFSSLFPQDLSCPFPHSWALFNLLKAQQLKG